MICRGRVAAKGDPDSRWQGGGNCHNPVHQIRFSLKYPYLASDDGNISFEDGQFHLVCYLDKQTIHLDCG
jgi:hypothetical protein